MRLLSDNPDARQRLGAAARRRIVENFGLDRMVRQYQELYEELLASPN
jgi:glycosyltransferase involved in cell wall biosynthesis